MSEANPLAGSQGLKGTLMSAGGVTVFSLKADWSDKAERGLFGLQVLRRRSKPEGPDIAKQQRKNVSGQANALFPVIKNIFLSLKSMH